MISNINGMDLKDHMNLGEKTCNYFELIFLVCFDLTLNVFVFNSFQIELKWLQITKNQFSRANSVDLMLRYIQYLITNCDELLMFLRLDYDYFAQRI